MPPLVVAEPLVLVVPLAAVPLLVVEAVEAVPPEAALTADEPVTVVPLAKYSNFRSITSGASRSSRRVGLFHLSISINAQATRPDPTHGDRGR